MQEVHVDSLIQPFLDLMGRVVGNNIYWSFGPSLSQTGGQRRRQPYNYLDGEALHVALLMPDNIRERWKDLVTNLSEYYNTPGRLAVVRRQFENACRPPGLDPATFAMELGILAVRGFADMNEKARDLMIRNKFIAAQRTCELSRHLDGAAAEASIGNIVDSCQIRMTVSHCHRRRCWISHFRRHSGQHGCIRTAGA